MQESGVIDLFFHHWAKLVEFSRSKIANGANAYESHLLTDAADRFRGDIEVVLGVDYLLLNENRAKDYLALNS